MKTIAKCSSALLLIISGANAYAADMTKVDTQSPVFASIPLEVEVGSRYWLSNGSYVGNLYDGVTPGQMNSRLTYNNMTGHSAEVFYRVEHETGVFLKGFFGGGTLASGKMNDEDFPPFEKSYSNTISVQSGGSLKYLTVDFGYDFLRGNSTNGLPFRIGAFVGYNNLHERMNTFGITQVGSELLPNTTNNFDGLDENTSWNSLRLGLGGEVTLLPGIRASLEGAWLRNWYYGTDYHNFRANIRGTPETGSGQGAQVEGIMSFDVTPQFSLGIGGRYWVMNAAALAHWEQIPSALTSLSLSSPLGVYSQRYGGFLQAAYRFGGPNNKDRGNLLSANFGKAEDVTHEWSGAYVGVNVGYGFGNSGVTNFSPLTNNSLNDQLNLYTPLTTRSDLAGFAGGGQAGYNLKLSAPIVVGAETDISYANIGGSVGTPSIIPKFIPKDGDEEAKWANVPADASSKSLITWFGTLRGRVGYLLRDDFLIYGTAGLAYGGISASGAISNYQNYPGSIAIGQYNQVPIGWTAGAGIEYAVAKNLSLKAEWLYLGFGNQNYALNTITPDRPNGYIVTINNDTQIIRTGVNYRLSFD